MATIYQCDRCGKRVETESALSTVWCHDSLGNPVAGRAGVSGDLCSACVEKVMRFAREPEARAG